MTKIPEVYTVAEVARALKLNPYTIRRLVREKKIPAIKIGGHWRFRKGDINRLLANPRKRKMKQ
ncbi:MAG: helix-turn-helix domain-containing protein [Candidatus Omnitrophota bacterium]|nr:helix-turn-helix domain-containing protein [Candidatus Omnitrophota bacterium]